MSITFHIAAYSHTERDALTTEATRTLNVHYSGGHRIQHTLRLAASGRRDPGELLARIQTADAADRYLTRRLPILVDIARAAARVGRDVTSD